jgi:CheY-like chemotaxis protein
LHRRGYGTLEAADGEEALQKSRWHKPDAITLDMMMPDMDGLRTLRALKQDRATAAIPTILVSVLGDPSRGDLAMGAFSFLRKPLDQTELRSAILAALHGRSGGKAVAVCLPETPLCEDFTAAAAKLQAEGIEVHLALSAPDAVAYVITETPALILLDTAMADAELFALITALKAEEEAARIPIVLMTDEIPQEGVHFHAGTDSADTAFLLDYLCEQIGQAVSGKAMSVK